MTNVSVYPRWLVPIHTEILPELEIIISNNWAYINDDISSSRPCKLTGKYDAVRMNRTEHEHPFHTGDIKRPRVNKC